MKDYYGWRARIGLVYINSSTVMEPEFYAMAPEGVTVHTTRVHLDGATVEGLSNLMDGGEVEDGAKRLAEAPLHSIVFGGTSATFLQGAGWDVEICKRMAAVSNGIPVTTTSTAVLKGLNAFGNRRVAFISPYVEEVCERARRFLTENGFEVTACVGMGIAGDHAIGDVKLEDVYEYTRRNVPKGTETVFMSCTNWRTVGAVAPLEEDLGLPVVTSNQASFWDALRLAGVGTKVQGFGRLFDF